MKNKRNWALYTAFLLYIVFGYFSSVFLEINTATERSRQTFLFYMIGILLSALVLPLLLPLRDLRDKMRPGRYRLRLMVTATFFLPNIFVRLQGPQVWFESPVNYIIMAFGNGAIAALVYGLFFTLAARNRAFWSMAVFSAGLFVYHLAAGPGQKILPAIIIPLLFYGSGIILVIAGFFLFLYLASIPAGTSRAGDSEPGGPARQIAKNSFSFAWVFPVLAGFIFFITNNFTDRLYIPIANLPFSHGFHPSTIVTILALPILGLLADRVWRNFLDIFIYLHSALLILSPSMLFFTHSQPLFWVIFTLGTTAMLLFTNIVPFVIVDLYWKKDAGPKAVPRHPGCYLSWLLPIAILLIRLQVQVQTVPFRFIKLDNAYAILLLSLAGIVFFVFMQRGLKKTPARTTLNPVDILKKHKLTDRETEVALLMVEEGLSNEEIAARITRSTATVLSHLTQIYRKFSVQGRTEFMAKVLKAMK